jgi:exodeoxyribonuclease VII large subunit
VPPRKTSSKKKVPTWTFVDEGTDSVLSLPELRSAETADVIQPSSNSLAPQAQSVTAITAQIREILQESFRSVRVVGEISGYRPAASGHVYFTIKDSGAALQCVLWARDLHRIKISPKDGDEVELTGRLTVYDQRGQYQLVVTDMTPSGVGRLYLEFLQLKERLTFEGLFDPGKKRTLPTTPKAVGVVTSAQGAAFRDIVSVLRRRAPSVRVYLAHARVQGPGAAEEMIQALDLLTHLPEIEVVILARGGGSLEDLWEFNHESLARAIGRYPLPVISAVGHETDFSISDFVADLRAATPSAAAEIVSRAAFDLATTLSNLTTRLMNAARVPLQLRQQIQQFTNRLDSACHRRLELSKVRLTQLKQRPVLRRPTEVLDRCRQRIDDHTGKLQAMVVQRIFLPKSQLTNVVGRLSSQGLMTVGRIRIRVQHLEHLLSSLPTLRLSACSEQLRRYQDQLKALDPTAVLQRGYAVLTKADRRVVRSVSEVSPGERIEAQVGDGKLFVTISDGLLSDESDLSAPVLTRARKSTSSEPATGKKRPVTHSKLKKETSFFDLDDVPE